jgi:hypothetical protein
MANDDLEPELLAIIANAIVKQRPYAGFFGWTDRPIQERGIARTFLDALRRTTEETLTFARSRGPGEDPPDCELVTDAGETIGLEITELVDQRAVEKAARGSYNWADWTAASLRQRIDDRIRAKDVRAKVKGGPYARYILLIHTAEPALTEDVLTAWVANMTFSRTELITHAFLLSSYDPQSETYPLRRLSLQQDA